MSSPAYDIASYIASTLGKGTLAGTIFVNELPDQPDNAIAVYEYGGRQSDKSMGNTNPLEWVHVQVAVRNANKSTAQSTAYDIYKSLDGAGPLTINSVEYLWLNALQPPFKLGTDGARTTWAFNLEIQKRRS